MKIKFFQTNQLLPMPQKNNGDIGIDLYANGNYTINPHERCMIDTGIKCDIEDGYALILKDRSGNAAKRNMLVCGGVIDSSYTGLISVIICNTSNKPISICSGERVCQAIVVKDYSVEIEKVNNEEDLKKTNRGSKGFGSSGL